MDASRYHDSNRYSDIIVRFNDGEIKAHKVVFASGSEYFRVAFESGFRESSAHTIDLHGDDRNAVKGMIAHFYGKSSQTDQYFPKELAPPVPRRDSTEYIKYLVDLYITATKHLAYSLQDRIKCMLEDFDNIHFGLNLTTVVHHIYVRHKDAETTSFRTQVARVTAEAVESLVQDDLSRKLLLEVPDFALDVIQALADQKSATSANGGNGKRQRR